MNFPLNILLIVSCMVSIHAPLIAAAAAETKKKAESHERVATPAGWKDPVVIESFWQPLVIDEAHGHTYSARNETISASSLSDGTATEFAKTPNLIFPQQAWISSQRDLLVFSLVNYRMLSHHNTEDPARPAKYYPMPDSLPRHLRGTKLLGNHDTAVLFQDSRFGTQTNNFYLFPGAIGDRFRTITTSRPVQWAKLINPSTLAVLLAARDKDDHIISVYKIGDKRKTPICSFAYTGRNPRLLPSSNTRTLSVSNSDGGISRYDLGGRKLDDYQTKSPGANWRTHLLEDGSGYVSRNGNTLEIQTLDKKVHVQTGTKFNMGGIKKVTSLPHNQFVVAGDSLTYACPCHATIMGIWDRNTNSWQHIIPDGYEAFPGAKITNHGFIGPMHGAAADWLSDRNKALYWQRSSDKADAKRSPAAAAAAPHEAGLETRASAAALID